MSFYADVLSSFDESLEKYQDNQFMVIDILIRHLEHTEFDENGSVLKHVMNKVSKEVCEQIKVDQTMKWLIED